MLCVPPAAGCSPLCHSSRGSHDYVSFGCVMCAAHPACLQAAREEAPPSTALATAKAQTMNSFVFNFASSGAQLQRRLIYTLLGVPKVGMPRQQGPCMGAPLLARKMPSAG